MELCNIATWCDVIWFICQKIVWRPLDVKWFDWVKILKIRKKTFQNAVSSFITLYTTAYCTKSRMTTRRIRHVASHKCVRIHYCILAGHYHTEQQIYIQNEQIIILWSNPKTRIIPFQISLIYLVRCIWNYFYWRKRIAKSAGSDFCLLGWLSGLFRVETVFFGFSK
jgi:hypothetical protein